MNVVADHVNRLPADACRDALARCCGAGRWVDGMLAARPFASDAAVFTAAERVWWALDHDDWLEAFARHPRIGDRTPVAAPPAARDWARQEQAGMAGASEECRRALVEGGHAYENRFGHVFLICATGRGADDMLAELRRRLRHDAATEFRVAAGEQAKITRLRLEKLVSK